MGNYRFDDDLHKKKQLPAGQRGIGCAMMMLLPLMSYFGAVELIKIKAIRLFLYASTPSLFGPPSLPPLLWKIKPITPLLNSLYASKDLEMHIVFGLVLLLILSGIISVFYATAYRAVAPPKYSGLDAPPARRKSSKKSR
ncbi:MAG: hypothetical protein HN392_02975 [Anaerolineae bacterium]|jgi:hypothetical protein|nr:hypothetical protein [Anaerolineae bacterium]MBT7075424.1 hypothetical protein [Anaerolineae bacterium]MBT7782931.1 hypothetical protein [Anaerolineae bacterium]